MTRRIGSLCSGYEGLGMAVAPLLGADLAWVADNDNGASKILAHRFPDLPNLGDITAVDWADVEPVDVVCAGFPCQPVSVAGQRKGVDDERWLFDDMAAAVGRMDPRPRLLLLENVPGLLAANGGDAMARVIPVLGALGYVGRYRLLRASDVGAPHRRERVFIAAWPAQDADGAASGQWGQPAPGQEASGRPRPDPSGPGGARAAADSNHDAARPGRKPGDAGRGRPEPSLRRVAAPADALGGHGDRWPDEPQRGPEGRAATRRHSAGGDPAADARGEGLEVRAVEHDGAERPAAERGRGDAAAHAESVGRGLGWRLGREGREGEQCGLGTAERDAGDIAWGPYEPGVRRWERILGRPAPRPTEPGRTGERLSPRFVEWMMGLPEGWVTDVPGLSRNDQLKALGNGVVPQQAAVAYSLLLPAWLEAAA